MKPLNLLPLMLATGILAGCAATVIDTADLGATRDTVAGRVLVDSRSMTLYRYDADTTGASHCTGICAIVWPPAKAAPGTAPGSNFSLVARNDGARQWAYKGQPLYGYAGDNAPGEVKGDGVDGVWHVVHP